MEKLTVYYSVRNGGDGSAYPTFMESSELCTWDQDHMYEGWGEDCSGYMSFESESPIICTDSIVTKEEYLIDRYIDAWDPNEDEMKEFIKEFFPDGTPTFSVKTELFESDYDDDDDKDVYYRNYIYVGDKLISDTLKREDKSGDVFEKELNSI